MGMPLTKSFNLSCRSIIYISLSFLHFLIGYVGDKVVIWSKILN